MRVLHAGVWQVNFSCHLKEVSKQAVASDLLHELPCSLLDQYLAGKIGRGWDHTLAVDDTGTVLFRGSSELSQAEPASRGYVDEWLPVSIAAGQHRIGLVACGESHRYC